MTFLKDCVRINKHIKRQVKHILFDNIKKQNVLSGKELYFLHRDFKKIIDESQFEITPNGRCIHLMDRETYHENHHYKLFNTSENFEMNITLFLDYLRYISNGKSSLYYLVDKDSKIWYKLAK